jgi:hypothetical protein
MLKWTRPRCCSISPYILTPSCPTICPADPLPRLRLRHTVVVTEKSAEALTSPNRAAVMLTCAWRIAESEHFHPFASLLGLSVRDLAILFIHLLATLARLAGPGGARSVVAESVLVKQQLLILNRSRKRSPHLRLSDRTVAGLCALLMHPGRLIRSAIVLKPSTLLGLHRALTKRKYRRLFSSKVLKKPGPTGPTKDVIAAVVDMKRRNPSWGCPRIAQQIALAFGIPMNKDVVRRILAVRHQPDAEPAGPSWLTLLGHTKDSLWSLDLFRCESAAVVRQNEIVAFWPLIQLVNARQDTACWRR